MTEELEEPKDPRYVDLAVRLAGELVLSNNPGKLMRFWREKAGVSQTRLAREMGISASVLSDYESGRRKSPGASFIKRFVNTLVKLDQESGSLLTLRAPHDSLGAIISIGEFKEPRRIEDIVDRLSLDVLVGHEQLNRLVYGYTILDSIKAIYAMSGFEFYRIFGSTTERVLVFTKVGLGRSPMVAIRVSQLKPRMVVIHGPERVDPLAIDLARRERLVFALVRGLTINQISSSLGSL